MSYIYNFSMKCATRANGVNIEFSYEHNPLEDENFYLDIKDYDKRESMSIPLAKEDIQELVSMFSYGLSVHDNWKRE